ncbi:MAG TPA: WD40 repeat domain-containing protein [Abditibacteriaceae bacterium]|jgi:WD40 repeat protein
MLPRSKWVRGIWLLLPLALFFAARQKVSWRPQKIMDLPFGVPEFVIISPDERFVANFRYDPTSKTSEVELPLLVRDLQNGREIKVRGFHTGTQIAAFDKEAQRIAFGWREIDDNENTKKLGVSVLSLNDKLRDFEIPKGADSWDYPTQLRFSPDGKTLWMASSDNLRSWDIATGKLKGQWSKEGEEIEVGDQSLPFNSAISEGCRYYFRADSHFGYSVWDIAKNKRLLRTKLPELSELTFSPDAELMVSVKRNVSVIDSKMGRVLWQSSAGTQLTLSNKLAIVKNENRFEVREARTGKLLRWLPAEGNARVVTSESVDWLYTVNDSNELFRQRLR